MLPYDPQPIPTLRARYPEAVREVFDVESVSLGNAARPGECPRCVFDFEDGLRLIVGREAKAGGTFLHVSASARPDSEPYRRIGEGDLGPVEFCRIAEADYREVSGDAEPLGGAFLSPGLGVPHWYRREGGRSR